MLYGPVSCGGGCGYVPIRGGLDASLRGSGTILVVDDEQHVLDVAKNALERYGYKVLSADGGAATINVFKRHPGEISPVTLGVSMPGMSGEETFPELRKIRPEVRVLISSGYSEAEAVRTFPSRGVTGFVQKPYTSRRLAEKVKAAIG